jgi:hypothetical protein
MMLAGTVVVATFLAAAWPVTAAGRGLAPARTGAVVAQELRADFNGDTLDDLAVGVPGEDIGTVRDAGAVNTLHGGDDGLAGTGQVLFQSDNSLGDVAEPNDRFGQALAKGRFSNNFNDDAFDDLAVGVAFEDVGVRLDAGLVNLLDGSAADGLLGSGTVLFQGADLGGGGRVGGTAEAGDLFGGSVE